MEVEIKATDSLWIIQRSFPVTVASKLFFFFVFRYSRSSLRDSVPDRVDLLESIESFSSTFLFRRPVGYVREPVTSTDYVYARLWLGYANVFPRKIASFVSHLRHADASICPTPSKSFHSDFLHPSIFEIQQYIYMYSGYHDYWIECRFDISTNFRPFRFSNCIIQSNTVWSVFDWDLALKVSISFFFFFILQIVLKYIYIYIEWNLIFYFS